MLLLVPRVRNDKVPQPSPLQVYYCHPKTPTLFLCPFYSPSPTACSSPKILTILLLYLSITLQKGEHNHLSHFVSYDKFTPFYQFTLSLSYVSIPRLYQKVMLVLAWQHAMNKEMQALRLSDPYATSMVGCPWVYTIKFNLDSSVNRYTARLVVKGFSYTYGVDYFKIFSPMALLNSIHILFS